MHPTATHTIQYDEIMNDGVLLRMRARRQNCSRVNFTVIVVRAPLLASSSEYNQRRQADFRGRWNRIPTRSTSSSVTSSERAVIELRWCGCRRGSPCSPFSSVFDSTLIGKAAVAPNSRRVRPSFHFLGGALAPFVHCAIPTLRGARANTSSCLAATGPCRTRSLTFGHNAGHT